ncbi:MAG: hypothetical protein GXO83_13165 [Chlorobi bacterium]|nr:hypothetical protein [Chlorobiota bacterium]
MELQHFIKELLFRHDCVIVPGFGGFVANYRPAEVNYQNHSFAPPSKDIVFNSELKDNDGLIIGHISKSSGMSYVDARNWVEKQVKELSRKLEKGRKVYLEDIGTFHLGKDKNILFEPAHSVNYLTESYGLPDFQFSPLETFKGEKKPTVLVTQSRVRKSWRWVAVAVPVVVALTLIPLKTGLLENIHIDLSSVSPFHKKANNKATYIQPSPEQKVQPAEHLKSEEPKVSSEEITPAESKEAEKTSPVEKTPVPVVRYYIVAGSFQHRSNAEYMKQQLIGEGKNAVIMDGPNGFLRVAYGGFVNKTAAENELSGIRRLKSHENYWLLRK